MRTALFLALILAIPGFAQYGTRIAQVQSVYLQDVPVPAGVTVPFAGPARIGELPEAPRPSGGTPAAVTPKAEFETWVEQRSRDYAESVVTGFQDIERSTGKAIIHRYVRDNFRNTSQTYTLTFEIISGTDTYRVVFSDATISYPLPQILRSGETITLTLAADNRTGRRMLDYIRIGTGNMTPRQGVARDVYAEDAQLTLTKPRLRINGVEQAPADSGAVVGAPVVPISVPGHGDYELSFRPRADEGFERAGEVAGNSLWFSSAGNIFRIDCAERIATGSGTYNIYARKRAG